MLRLFENRDCMEGMAEYPDKFFDLCLTDPPYNVGRKYNSHNDMNPDYHSWCNKWFDELQRICKTIVFTCGYKNLSFWLNKEPRGMIVWHKSNQNSPSTLGGFNVWEPVLFWGYLHKRIGHDFFSMDISMQKDAAFHNCPKYLLAWIKILKMVIDPPAIIFDPFVGSGTTLKACEALGFEYVGFEIDKDYYEAAKKRLENWRSLPLFDEKKAEESNQLDLAI